MLNYKLITGTLGAILLAFGCLLLIPMMIGILLDDNNTWWTFGGAAIVGIALGVGTWNIYRPEHELNTREAFAVVGLAWFVVPFLCALPFVWSGVIASYPDALFESISGLTATGASVFSTKGYLKLEDVPFSFLFWRSFLQWIGSLAIIVLATAYLPFLGIGGMQLFRSEITGPASHKLSHRFRVAAGRVWILYLGLTLVLMLLLTPAMDFGDAICHAMSTVSTGGFSTRTDSIEAFKAPYLEWVLIIFMFFGGVNFNFIYHAVVEQDFSFFKRRNFVVYAFLALAATLLTGLSFYQPVAEFWGWVWGGNATKSTDDVFEALRIAAFQVTSLSSTTGFGITNPYSWTPFCSWIFVVLAIIGGMAGSGAGGLKVIRLLLIVRQIAREIILLIHPKAIISIRVDNDVVSNDIMRTVASFVLVFLLTIFVGMGLMSLCGLDMIHSFFMTISALSGVGPALAGLGGGDANYGAIPVFGKMVLSFIMLLGRLEIFTVLLLLFPGYWRK
jgi:trk system potassium uptake protein TrkH